jgi:hypothetical protein
MILARAEFRVQPLAEENLSAPQQHEMKVDLYVGSLSWHLVVPWRLRGVGARY